MRRHQRDAAFTSYVDARRPALIRTAYLLCGDWHRAEDLVQQSLVKLYGAWPQVGGKGGEDAYVRRILANTHIDEWRWRARRPETPVSDHVDRPGHDQDRSGDRDALRNALRQLPEGQRKVLVLRFWLDLSVAETAQDLRVTPGTVKSQTARGLDRLRELLGDGLDDTSMPAKNTDKNTDKNRSVR